MSFEIVPLKSIEQKDRQKNPKKVTLLWQPSLDAVKYRLVLLKSADFSPQNILKEVENIYTNGYELDLKDYQALLENLYWCVYPLDLDGNVLGTRSEVKSIQEGFFNLTSPFMTSEFSVADLAPLYPVFSWIPFLNATGYEINVFQRGKDGIDDKRIRHLFTYSSSLYDDFAYTKEGLYYYQVRPLDNKGRAIGNWSRARFFRVNAPVTVAALGDSITHGGGAISVPPGYKIYEWESYVPFPVKNLGCSGNTTENMAERFFRDVLPFSPKILVIMGGVNDFRAGVDASTTIYWLSFIRDACLKAGIIPVFMTATPIHPWFMARTGAMNVPASNWQENRQKVNAWILKQKYALDVSTALTDKNGNLKDGYSADGLHPDFAGKKYIGEKIGSYLLKTFPDILKIYLKK